MIAPLPRVVAPVLPFRKITVSLHMLASMLAGVPEVVESIYFGGWLNQYDVYAMLGVDFTPKIAKNTQTCHE